MTVDTKKFRGQDEHGYWHFGLLVETDCGLFYIIENNEGQTDDNFHNDNFSGWYKVLEKTIGQFTGLFDKNGREIYEDDIVNITDESGVLIGHGVVKWLDNQELWYVDGEDNANGGLFDINFDKYLVVIGNTHDNLELIKN
jgi:uncharacterized phage protein (TIGR01671 family)